MNEIAKTHDAPFLHLPAGHPVQALWLDSERGVIARVQQALREAQAHPARTVVLLPYAQLMPLARALWAQAVPNGFAPRFETTLNWTRSLGAWAPQGDDITHDVARDLLTAQALLERAGLGAQREALAGSLVQIAHQLAGLVAAVRPAERAAWAASARAVVTTALEAPLLALESATARIALEWALASGYATDALFDERLLDPQAGGLDCLIVLEGFQAEPLAEALKAFWGRRAVSIALHSEPAPPGQLALHEAQDAEDEAQRAAACVLQQLAAGRSPVALVATDRALTRRIRAMLAAREVAMRDETGWKLSTTRAAAHVMGLLRACAWNASSDAVLDWLKNAPAFEARAVAALEKELRKAGAQEWRSWGAMDSVANAALAELSAEANQLREGLQRARPLLAWLAALRSLLQASGQWPLLLGDAAGDKLLAVLRLDEAAMSAFEQSLSSSIWAARRLSLAEFTAWVNEALEAASFVPAYPSDERVVILPLSQLLARPFGALVLPGCDELRLSVSPEPPGPWTAAQRQGLGLPSRETLEGATRAAWRHALQTPCCDLLWRCSDEGGEPLLPSPLVQALQLDNLAAQASDPRSGRELAAQPTLPPQPRAPDLPLTRLSASAYEDLRRCPYRFFALRQLGLKEADELKSEVDKRDFGLWLHAVLKGFHEALQASVAADGPARLALLEAAADAATQAMRLAEDEFLPFAAAWPRVRDGYLAWLAQHEAAGASFEQAERWLEQPLGELTLIGQIDRIDRLAGGQHMVIDYKTESQGVTRERIKQPSEDTQLAFYAALLPDDTLRAAYVNVGEKEATRSFEQTGVVQARDALVEGILHDMARIAEGAPLPALGDGAACEHCAARGLCRKDFREGSA